MAWPPPTMPTTRTDTTVMATTHPAEHNAVNLAINDIVARMQRRIWFSAFNGGTLWSAGQTAPMLWPSEASDVDGFGNGTATITVPAGLDGVYAISYYVLASTAVSQTTVLSILIAGGIWSQAYIAPGLNQLGLGTTRELAAGATVQLNLANSGVATTYSGQIRLFRLGP